MLLGMALGTGFRPGVAFFLSFLGLRSSGGRGFVIALGEEGVSFIGLVAKVGGLCLLLKI